MPPSQPLPPKENALFKRILKCYEQKQYKNGLKFAKQILSNPKFSEHGETLSMKGLTLNCLGRKEEAYDYVRRGLRNDLKSHVCWHVYGLLQRSDKKYEEAIKCYRNALKWEPENIQILRDLSLLQVQMRDLEGYKETRFQLFKLRPSQRASWIGVAMSYHLLSDYEKALSILEEFRKTQQKAAYDYEHSELLLYQNMVIQESGDHKAALEHLDTYEEQICDKLSLLETRGANMIKVNRLEEAEKLYLGLIKRNPENHLYYHQLEVAKGATTIEEKLEIYAEMSEKYPKAQAPQRLALEIAQGDVFKSMLDKYMRKALRKGIPPLFVDLVPLYENKSKASIIGNLCQGYYDNLKTHDSFDTEDCKEPATALLWLLYYLAQHYDHNKDFQKALETVDEAINHTPTLIELFMLKGKIFKHVGNLDEAVNCFDEAQSLDTADRYINCKCAKYMLRANRIREAEEMCQKFTREGVSATESLNEMQCMWFQTECAGAFQRKGLYGEALKKCHEVERHFTEIVEDQFDFHTYCTRKMTLRSYVELLRLEDVLRSHRFYKKASHCAINVYLLLHDKPLQNNDDINDSNPDNLNPSELKKLRNKQRKAQKKAELEKQNLEQVAKKKEMHNKTQKKNNEEELDSPAKDDLVPDKLERPDDPLAEAIRFLTPLQMLASNSLSTHLFAFEIYYRKEKPLLMLQSLKRMLKVDASDPQVHGCLIRFQNFVEVNSKGFAGAVNQVIDQETQSIFTTKSARERNEQFIQSHSKTLDHRLVGAKMQALLDPSNLESAVQLATKLDDSIEEISLKTCAEAYDLLLSGDFGASGSDSAESYRQVCQKFFPYATKFNLNSKDTSETPEDTIEDTTTHNNSTSNNNGENNSEKITNSSPVKAEINEPEP